MAVLAVTVALGASLTTGCSSSHPGSTAETPPKATDGTAPKAPGSTAPKAPGIAAPKAPGGSQSQVPGGSGDALALADLGSLPDTAANRSSIVVNDFSAIWAADDIPVPPSVRDLQGEKGVEATTQLLGGSPAGSQLWDDLVSYPAPLGYPALDLRGEVVVGSLPNSISAVWGPVSSGAVVGALGPLHPRTTVDPQGTTLDLGGQTNYLRPGPFADEFQDVGAVVIPRSGGRLATGGAPTPPADVAALAFGTPAAHPLSADPDVATLLRAFGPSFQSLAMGTSWVAPNGGDLAHASAAVAARVKGESGLGRLPAAPITVGIAYTKGSSAAQSVVAAALYPTAADARAALGTVARFTATGTSPRLNVPYGSQWQVDGTTVQGRMVVMDLTTRRPGSVSQAVVSDDFPLFWGP